MRLLAHRSEPILNPKLYRSIVGGLQHATITRLGISYSMNKVSQFMHNSLNSHWQVVKRILQYLNDTLYRGLYLSKPPHLFLECFFDADWPFDPDDMKSTSDYYIFLGQNLVTWSSKKKHTSLVLALKQSTRA